MTRLTIIDNDDPPEVKIGGLRGRATEGGPRWGSRWSCWILLLGIRRTRGVWPAVVMWWCSGSRGTRFVVGVVSAGFACGVVFGAGGRFRGGGVGFGDGAERVTPLRCCRWRRCRIVSMSTTRRSRWTLTEAQTLSHDSETVGTLDDRTLDIDGRAPRSRQVRLTGTITDDDDPPVLGIVADEDAFGERSGEVSLTVSLTNPVDKAAVASEKAVQVGYGTVVASDPQVLSVAPGVSGLGLSERKAAEGADYVALSGETLMVAAGSESATLEVTLADDVLDEFDEVFAVRLDSPVNASLGTAAAGAAGASADALVVIADNDDPPAVVVTAPTDPVVEDAVDAAAVFGVGLSAPSGRTVSVDYRDQVFTLERLARDHQPALSGLPSGGGCSAADAAKSPLPLGCVRALEHAAAAGADFTAATGTLRFAPGETAARQVSVSVVGDDLDEWDEVLALELTPTYATVPAEAVPAVIADDDDPPTLTVPASDRAETFTARELALDMLYVSGVAVESEGSLFLSGSLSEVSGRSAAVNFKTSGNNAVFKRLDGDPTAALDNYRTIQGDDYCKVPLTTASLKCPENDGVWVFAPGMTTGRFALAVIDDTVRESATEEYFVAELHSAEHLGINGYFGEATDSLQVLLEVRDDDRVTLLEMADAAADETAGTVTVTVTVPSSVSATRPSFDVECSTADGTATAGSDYTAIPAMSLTLDPADPAERSKTIDVTIAADALSEIDETFSVSCTAQLDTPETVSAVVTIVDTSALPTLSVSPAALTRTEANAAVVFTVELSAASGRDVSVRVSTADGTAAPGATPGAAVAGEDYRALDRVVSLSPGTTTATFEVSLVDDEVLEPDETFTVTLVEPMNAELAASASATITIDDNDDLPLLSIAAGSAVENSAQVTFTVTLDPAAQVEVTVEYATAGPHRDGWR